MLTQFDLLMFAFITVSAGILHLNKKEIKKSLYGLVPCTPVEKFIDKVLDLSIWVCLGNAALLVLLV